MLNSFMKEKLSVLLATLLNCDLMCCRTLKFLQAPKFHRPNASLKTFNKSCVTCPCKNVCEYFDYSTFFAFKVLVVTSLVVNMLQNTCVDAQYNAFFFVNYILL